MMRKFLQSSKPFYVGVFFLITFEFLLNFLTMPYPGSQKLDSIKLAYFLHHHKFYFELFSLLWIAIGGYSLFKGKQRLILLDCLTICVAVYIYTSHLYTAERRFPAGENPSFQSVHLSTIDKSEMVMTIGDTASSKAFPLPMVMFHHQILDTFLNRAILVTYCPICQTGRVYEPYINGVYTKFRLVGVNRGNAMFEDERTKSWWSQETGECIAGELKSSCLKSIPTKTLTMEKAIAIYPNIQILQPDLAFQGKYQNRDFYDGKFANENIISTKSNWNPKAFVIGIKHDGLQKAYDWNNLRTKRLINDSIGIQKVLLCVSMDKKSFVVYENNSNDDAVMIQDTIQINDHSYDFSGREINGKGPNLKPIEAYREYWFSWRYANKNTIQYQVP